MANNDGATWNDMDSTNLKLVLTPATNCVATLSANTDLWTANAGTNTICAEARADGLSHGGGGSNRP